MVDQLPLCLLCGRPYLWLASWLARIFERTEKDETAMKRTGSMVEVSLGGADER